MKELLFGIVLILVLGIGGFIYRNALERPAVIIPNGPGGAVACTTEAKVCPDGTSVGRTGPDCSFAACALPNIELGTLGLSFALPVGYAPTPAASTTDHLVAAYEKTSKTPTSPHAIVIRDYPIPAGKTANAVILANTMHESSGLPAKSMKEFTPVIVNGKTFQSITVERFEGQIHSLYYLARANDVIRFEVLERDVTNWTDASLVEANLPEHKALLAMLATLQTQ